MKIQLTVDSIQTLSNTSKALLASVGIRLKKASGLKVKLTQVAEAGVSFEFLTVRPNNFGAELQTKEYHVPARMVREIFA
jgi:hypothetical protein